MSSVIPRRLGKPYSLGCMKSTASPGVCVCMHVCVFGGGGHVWVDAFTEVCMCGIGQRTTLSIAPQAPSVVFVLVLILFFLVTLTS